MESVDAITNSIILRATNFVIRYFYKWLLPVVVTITAILFTDKDNSWVVLFFIWLLHCVAYITLPLNFDTPKREHLAYIKNNLRSAFLVLLQASVLSMAVFGLTLIFVVWYLPQIAIYGAILSACNGMLYFLTIISASYIVAKNIQA